MRAVALLGRDVLDAGHHRPALAERVDHRREPVAGDERLCRLADRRACALGPRHDIVDVGAVQPNGVSRELAALRRGQLVGLLRVRQLQTARPRSVAEIQFGVRDDAVRPVHPLDEFGAEHRNVEVDGVRLV